MNNECDIQVNAKVIRPACNLPNILLPLPPQYLSQDARIVKSSPCCYILMSFFLYLLILIRAGIVSCVYVRVVIIVVINDSSILTTGLNTTLNIYNLLHTIKPGIQESAANKYRMKSEQI